MRRRASEEEDVIKQGGGTHTHKKHTHTHTRTHAHAPSMSSMLVFPNMAVMESRPMTGSDWSAAATSGLITPSTSA